MKQSTNSNSVSEMELDEFSQGGVIKVPIRTMREITPNRLMYVLSNLFLEGQLCLVIGLRYMVEQHI